MLTDSEINDLGRLLAKLVASHLHEEGNTPAPVGAADAESVADDLAQHRRIASALRAQNLSKSEVIRRLYRDEGLSRSEIVAAMGDVRYQFVQNVLKQAGLLPSTTASAVGA